MIPTLFARMLRGAAFAASLSLTLVGVTGCGVEVGAEYPDGYYDDYPPSEYIATTAPIYYEGRPAYFYHEHWYYRDGGRWAHYDHEPAALYRGRIAAPPVRRNYEPTYVHRGGYAPAHFSGGVHVGGSVHGGRR